MSQENADTVRSAYEHLNRGDVESLVGLCDDDFLIDMPVSLRLFRDPSQALEAAGLAGR